MSDESHFHYNNSETSNLSCSECGLSSTAGDPTYALYNHACVVIILPTLVALGFTGNTLAVVVFLQRSMRSSANTYLAALGVCDILVVLTALFMFTFENLRHTNETVKLLFFAAVSYVYPLAMMVQTCSVYLTVSAGVDCFLSVWFPKLKGRFCTVKRAKMVVACVVLLAMTYNFPHIFEIRVRSCVDEETNKLIWALCATPLRQDPFYTTVYYVYMYTTFMTVGPILLLACLNVLIILRVSQRKQKLKRRSRDLSLCSNGQTPSETVSNGSRKASLFQVLPDEEDPTTLVLVVLIFIFCNTLGLIINFLELLLPDIGPSLNYLVDASNVLVAFNSSLNFLIYVAFSLQFRTVLKKLLRKFLRRLNLTGGKKHPSHSHSANYPLNPLLYNSKPSLNGNTSDPPTTTTRVSLQKKARRMSSKDSLKVSFQYTYSDLTVSSGISPDKRPLQTCFSSPIDYGRQRFILIPDSSVEI